MQQLPDELKSLQFFIVDDYMSMILLLTKDLKSLGVTKITTANSGFSAFNKIKESMGTPNEVQFVITDMLMPDGTGREMTEMLRKDPLTKHLPILMISSMTDVGLMLDCVKAGITNYIVKPWELSELINKIVTSYKKVKKIT